MAVEENSRLSRWMNSKYIFFSRIEDLGTKMASDFLGVVNESECNLAVPRTFLGFSRSSLATGHTMHTGTLQPPSLLVAPRQRARWPLPHRLPKSFVLRIFYGTVRQSWLSTSRNVRLVLADFFIFRAPFPSLWLVIRSIKSFWVSFSSHWGRIFSLGRRKFLLDVDSQFVCGMYFPYNKCDNLEFFCSLHLKNLQKLFKYFIF